MTASRAETYEPTLEVVFSAAANALFFSAKMLKHAVYAPLGGGAAFRAGCVFLVIDREALAGKRQVLKRGRHHCFKQRCFKTLRCASKRGGSPFVEEAQRSVFETTLFETMMPPLFEERISALRADALTAYFGGFWLDFGPTVSKR